MGRIARAATAFGLACACLIETEGCGRRVEAPVAAGTDPDARAADSASLERLTATARSAASFHRDLAELDWITGLMAAAADSSRDAFFPRGFGATLAAPLPAAGEPSMMTAFQKAGAARPRRLGPAPHGRALAKAALDVPDIYFEGDTSWFDYRDSAQGRVRWIHVLRDPDFTVQGEVRDSLVYRWPSVDSTPVLLSSSTALRRFLGGEYRLELSDEDGDGTLNGSAAGRPVRIRKEWTSAIGDTVHKSVWHLDRGTESRPGEAEGEPVSFTDTTFAFGRVVSLSVTSDGDGDGYAWLAAPGREPRTVVETAVMTDDGSAQRVRITAGPGPDGDGAESADNPWYAYARALTGPFGDTLEAVAAGDADGDGCVFDPMAAGNRAWLARRLPAAPGRPAYRDSVVKILGDPEAGSADRIAFAWARLDWPDGSASIARARPEAGPSFGSGDTVLISESRAWPRGQRPGEPDSIAREAILAVGDAGAPDDDHVLWSTVRTWRAPGAAVESSGETRAGGTWSYAAVLPGGRKAAGVYEPAAGTFSDTLDGTLLAGSLSEDGSAEYQARHAGEPEARRVRVTRSEGAFSIRIAGDGEDVRYDQEGDTTRWTEARGGLVHYHTAIADGEGGYDLGVKGVDRAGRLRLDGAFRFEADGIGSGWLREGGEKTGFRFPDDGAPRPDAR